MTGTRYVAERAGFEPAVRFWRTHAFQACTFDRSVTSPCPQAQAARDSISEHLPRIHDSKRVERALDGPHQLDLHRRLVAHELVPLVLADAVLGADRAAEFGDAIVHDAVHSRR